VVRSKAWGEESGLHAARIAGEERGPSRRPTAHMTA
jgi:hypothetical protein